MKNCAIEEAKNPSDWTILMRRILKLERVIELAFLIVDEIELLLKKKRIEESQRSEVPLSHQSFSNSTSQSLLVFPFSGK